MDTGQKTESIAQLVEDIVKDRVALPEFQRDFVWDIEKTFDLFDSFVRDIFIGSLIYGVPSFEITVRELDRRPRSGKGSRAKLKVSSYTRDEIENRVKINGFRLLLDGQQRATSIQRAMTGVDPVFFVAFLENELPPDVQAKPAGHRSAEEVLSQFLGEPVEGRVSISLHDVYRVLKGDASREKEKADLFLKSNRMEGITAANVETSPEFLTYLTQLKNLENLCRQEKLVAYYLLDTDEEKFALFFERSGLALPSGNRDLDHSIRPEIFAIGCMALGVPMANASLYLTEEVKAAFLGQVSEVANEVCDGMLVACATMLLENSYRFGGPRDVVRLVDHRSIILQSTSRAKNP
jgi:hypothetical protein